MSFRKSAPNYKIVTNEFLIIINIISAHCSFH